MNILCTSFPSRDLQQDLQEKYPDHQFHFQNHLEVTDDKLACADILITMGEDFTIDHLKQAGSLKWISCLSAGVEKLPLQAIRDRGVTLTNARGIHAIPMAEYALGMLLSHVKCFRQQFVTQQKSQWEKKYPFQELHGKTLLLLGTGAIAKKVAQLAAAFSVEVLGVNYSGHAVAGFERTFPISELLQILPQADFVISILPSTPATKQLLQEEHFQAMKNSALFMNLGRGNLFADSILLKSLQTEQIAAAVLDVFHEEPLPADHPYWQLENVTVTSHTSSYSANYMPKALGIFERNFDQFLQGKQSELENIVDLTRGY